MSEHSSTSTSISCCQFQKIADQFFRDFSRLIAKWPLMFCIFPVCVTVALGSGIYLNRKVFETPADSDNQVTNYLPENVDSIRNWRQLMNLFDFADLTPRSVYDSFKRSYAYVILVDQSNQQNMLTDVNLKLANEIVKEIKKMRVQFKDWLDIGWPQLCQKMPGTISLCLEHPFIVYLNSSSSSRQATQNLMRYPVFQFGNVTIDNTLVLGSVTVDDRGFVQKAKAVRLPFVLQFTESDERRMSNYLWQKEFVKLMKTLRHPSVGIYFSTSSSLTDQIDQNGKMLVQYLPVVFCILVSFSVFCCCTSDWVLSQPWLGFCGILTAAQAVIVAIGILLYCGYPFLQMVFIMPFLILSVSADNAFLVLSCWRNTHPLISIEERVAQSVGGTSVSIMITALTDGLSFAVGSISQFPAVRLFCTYCALAILCAFVYQMTFFTACLALCGRREAANRHCVCFVKVQPKSESDEKSFLYQIFCAGGYFSAKQKRIPLRLHSHLLTEFLGNHLGTVLCSLACKILIILLYFGYISSAIWGVVNLKIGLQMKNLVPYESYVAKEKDISDEHFSAYGSFAFVVITEKLEYHDEFNLKRLGELYKSLSSTEYSSEGEFWLHDFVVSGMHKEYNSETEFISVLDHFLNKNENRKYRSDFRFDSNRTRVLATKFYVRLRNVGNQNLTLLATELRKKFARFSFQGFVFDSTFLLVDQEEATIRCVLQDVFIAVGVMIGITLLFIPKILCALWIGLSILSINVGVIGYLSLWNVRLDIVSMITTVMSVGLSVDYVAHVTYHYLVVHTSDSNLRMQKTLRHVAVPTVQSAIATILGVSILGFVESYMIQTFVKTVVLVVSLGVLHGLLFLPVALSMFIPADQFLESFGHYDKVREYLATNLNLSKYFGAIPVRNKRMVSYFVRAPAIPPARTAQSCESVVLQVNPHPSLEMRKSVSDDSKSEVFTDETAGMAGDLYGFLKSKTSKKSRRSSYSGTADVQSMQFFFGNEESKVSNKQQPSISGLKNIKSVPRDGSDSSSTQDSSDTTDSIHRLCSRPVMNFPPPPDSKNASSMDDSGDSAHFYDAPNDADGEEKQFKYFEGNFNEIPSSSIGCTKSSSFKRHKYHSDYGRGKLVVQKEKPHFNIKNKNFTQSEVVQIVLNGNLGSRSALTKSFSLDNLDKSLQSLADSDYFGVVKGDQNENKKKCKLNKDLPSDMKTFKSAKTFMMVHENFRNVNSNDTNSTSSTHRDDSIASVL